MLRSSHTELPSVYWILHASLWLLSPPQDQAACISGKKDTLGSEDKQ